MNLGRMTIGTFNLYNLNEPGLPIYRDRDGWSPEAYEAKIAWTGRTIASLAPDVFGFQELWHEASLLAAVERAGVVEDYDLLVPPGTDGGRIVCAAMVRKGLLSGEAEWITSFPEGFVLRSSGDDPQTPDVAVNLDSFSRPILRFRIRPREEREDTHVFVCHFKSKSPTQVYREDWFAADEALYRPQSDNLGAALSTIRRTAEASALRYMLTAVMKETRTSVIVVGDVNDGQHSNTMNILTEQPRYLVGDSRGGGDISLYTAQTLQQLRSTRDVYYTHIYQDIMESLDHILVSEEFYDNSRRRQWMFDGLTIGNDHLHFEDRLAAGTNDHGVVCAAFRYSPAGD